MLRLRFPVECNTNDWGLLGGRDASILFKRGVVQENVRGHSRSRKQRWKLYRRVFSKHKKDGVRFVL